MAEYQQDRAFRFENVSIFKDEDSQLGVGSYGAVYKAKCDQLPCAAKILHPVLFQTNDPGSRKILERFEQECGFLSSIRHPNIVQYLGVCRDHGSRLPVLLMELLDSSLTKYLEAFNKPLSYHVQVDLCFDVAVAIAYLHSNGIIHRDLSGNNVLIVAGSRAKVTDFGMSKLVDASSRLTLRTLTQCPGTEVYMPPEALKEPPVYTKMLDCFSFGVLVVQTLTRLYPNPGPRTRLVPFPASPTGHTDVPIIDTERRKEQIDKISPAHPLVPVATECLKYDQEDRPSVQQLCEQLATLKEAPKYSESKQRMQESSSPVGNDTTDKDRTIRELQQQIKEKAHVIQVKILEIQEYERGISGRDRMLHALNSQLQDNEQALAQKDHEISDKVRMLRDLNRQLQDNEQVVAALHQTLTQREKVIRDLRESISARDSDINDLQCQLQHLRVEQPQAKVGSKTVKLRWRDGGRAPEKMHFGSCAADGHMAYFRYGSDVHAHNATTGKWKKMRDCPNRSVSFAMVVVNGVLTAVGGRDSSDLDLSDTDTNKLLSLVGGRRWSLVEGRKWVDQLPSMPTKRHYTAAVCSGKTLVVIGGQSGSNVHLKTVELLDIDSLQWFIASELPHSLHSASATVCGNHLYLVGGFDERGPTKSVLTCSLSALVQSAKPATQTEQVWCEVASLPVVRSTCASLNGQLIAVGGFDSVTKLSNSVYAYNPRTDHWDVISTMPTARYDCLVAVLPGNQLMVVGGCTEQGKVTDKVEVATF